MTEREMIRYCNETGVGIIPVSRSSSLLLPRADADSQWAPLCRGHLARPLASFGESTRSKSEKGRAKLADSKQTGSGEVDRKIIHRVEELATNHKWKMSHVALAWINKRVSSPIIGFSSEARIDEALDTAGKTLTDDEENYLEELYEPKTVMGHS